MEPNNQNLQFGPNEFDFINLIRLLVDKKWLISGITGLITLITVIYVSSFTPTYNASTSFTLPGNSETVEKVNFSEEVGFRASDRQNNYINFLNKISSNEFQKKVFVANGYIADLNPDNQPIDDMDSFINAFLKSISVTSNAFRETVGGVLYRDTSSLSMNGKNEDIIIRFLNDLVFEANKKTIDEFIHFANKRITDRLNEISLERGLLLIKAKQDRLNEIEILNEAAKMANFLGIKENNFDFGKNEIDSIIALNLSNNPIPIWYLYGEEALLQRISLLKNRSDDSPFVQEINELDIEKLRLESFNLENETLNAIEITKLAEANTIAYKPSKRLLVTLAFFVGLILSLIIVIINYKINFDNELTDSTT